MKTLFLALAFFIATLANSQDVTMTTCNMSDYTLTYICDIDTCITIVQSDTFICLDDTCNINYVTSNWFTTINFATGQPAIWSNTPDLQPLDLFGPYGQGVTGAGTTTICYSDTLLVTTNELITGFYEWYIYQPLTATWGQLPNQSNRFLNLPGAEAQFYKLRYAESEIGIQLGQIYSCWVESEFLADTGCSLLSVDFDFIRVDVDDTIAQLIWYHHLDLNGPFYLYKSYTGDTWQLIDTVRECVNVCQWQDVIFQEAFYKIQDQYGNETKPIFARPELINVINYPFGRKFEVQNMVNKYLDVQVGIINLSGQMETYHVSLEPYKSKTFIGQRHSISYLIIEY